MFCTVALLATAARVDYSLPEEAAFAGDKEAVKSWLDDRKERLDTLGPRGMAVMHIAAINGQHELAEMMIDYGASLDERIRGSEGGQFDSWTPLMLASVRGHLRCQVLLLERGAKVHLRLPDGRTAMDLVQQSINDPTNDWWNPNLEQAAEFLTLHAPPPSSVDPTFELPAEVAGDLHGKKPPPPAAAED